MPDPVPDIDEVLDDDCPDCDGSGWIEDESDWQDADAVDPKTGAAVYPLVPCPTCNPGGQGALY